MRILTLLLISTIAFSGDKPFSQSTFEHFNKKQTILEAFRGSQEEAQKAAAEFVALLEPKLGRPVGYKAALTSPPAQKRFGVTEPVAGVFLQKMLRKNGATVSPTFGAVSLFEGDLMLRVDSPDVINAATRAELLAGVDAVVPFLELPDLMYKPGLPLNGPAITAVNAGARCGVVGTAFLLKQGRDWEERLPLIEVSITEESGKVVASGKASDLLGHPLDAALWLVGSLRSQGVTLKKGDLLSLGSMTQMVPVGNTQKVTAVYTGLDPMQPIELTVNFGEEKRPR